MGTMKTFWVIRVGNDAADTHAAETLGAALDLSGAMGASDLWYTKVEAPDAGAARLMGRSWTALRPCDLCWSCEQALVTVPDHVCEACATECDAIPAEVE